MLAQRKWFGKLQCTPREDAALSTLDALKPEAYADVRSKERRLRRTVPR